MTDETYELRMTVPAMRDLVQRKLSNRKHWIFLPGIAGFDALNEIERKFYPGGLASDFEKINTPFDKTGLYGFVFGVRHRLSPATLAAFLREKGPWLHMEGRSLTGPDLVRQPLITLADAQESALLVRNFNKWLWGQNATNGH